MHTKVAQTSLIYTNLASTGLKAAHVIKKYNVSCAKSKKHIRQYCVGARSMHKYNLASIFNFN